MTSPPAPTQRPSLSWVWLYPLGLLACAYGLLGLTFTEQPDHDALMMRCVLMDMPAARVWSVANVEVGAAYFGVFFAMLYHVLRASRTDRTHLRDMALAFAYLVGSFLLNFYCVVHFHPLTALVIGDVVVLTFTAIVSQQLWFQRLLGVFVPLVFFTCGMGHLLEGMSFWTKTYTWNVPCAMVTADIGFAVLLNAARFPAFIRGQSLIAEIEAVRAEASARFSLVRDILMGATQGRLRLCGERSDLPERLPEADMPVPFDTSALSAARALAAHVAEGLGFEQTRVDQVRTAVGEAAMNAVVHADGGTLTVCANEDVVQVWIEDHGSGMNVSELPRATLERGFSTKGSLGHGFWLMLNMTDQVSLHTTRSGTTVVLTFYREPTGAMELAFDQSSHLRLAPSESA